jgi:hypothetical protein
MLILSAVQSYKGTILANHNLINPLSVYVVYAPIRIYSL